MALRLYLKDDRLSACTLRNAGAVGALSRGEAGNVTTLKVMCDAAGALHQGQPLHHFSPSTPLLPAHRLFSTETSFFAVN